MTCKINHPKSIIWNVGIHGLRPIYEVSVLRPIPFAWAVSRPSMETKNATLTKSSVAVGFFAAGSQLVSTSWTQYAHFKALGLFREWPSWEREEINATHTCTFSGNCLLLRMLVYALKYVLWVGSALPWFYFADKPDCLLGRLRSLFPWRAAVF